MPLKLPLSVAVATREEDLEVLSALGAGKETRLLHFIVSEALNIS